MKPAICTSFDYNLPFARVMPMIRQAGFEVVSIGARPQHSDYHTLEGRAVIKRLADEYELEIDSVHAPFPEGDRLFDLDEANRLQSVRQCKIAIDAAADLNGRIVVIHLIQPYGIPHGDVRDRMIAQGMISVRALADYAVAKGVKVAFENGQKLDYDQVLEVFLTKFSGNPIGFCYDSGHENVQGTCFRMLEKFGRRLLSVHLHDNTGSDTHMLPFEGNIDWEQFKKIFHKLDYSGKLLLEADIKNSQFKDPELFLSEARKRAERLMQPPA